MTTNTKSMDFSDLLPTRDTFNMPDGQQLEFVSRSEFSAEDLAELSRLQKMVQSGLKAGESKSKREKARGARTLDKALHGLLKCVLPGILETDEYSSMTAGQKLQIVNWWTARNQSEEDELAAFLDDDLGED